MGWVTIEGPLEIFEAHTYFLFEKTVSSGHLHPIAVNLFKPNPQRPGYGCFVECRVKVGIGPLSRGPGLPEACSLTQVPLSSGPSFRAGNSRFDSSTKANC